MKANGHRWGVILLAGLLVCAGAQTTEAQSKEAQPQSRTENGPVLRATTRLVQLNVIVEDRHGKAVGGLRPEDFQLWDNGKARKIALFVSERERKASAAAVAESEAKPAANVFDNRAEAGEASQGSVTVVLFDALNTSFSDQAHAKAEILAFLRQLRPQDHVAVYLLTKRLTVINEFTQDAESLLAAVERLRTAPSLLELKANQAYVSPSDTGLQDPKAALRAANLTNEMNSTLSDIANVERMQITAQALEGIANHVAGVPGRKNLIWVSGSFPVSIAMSSNERSPVDLQSQNFAPEMERVARAFSQANLAIYPVDAHGLIIPSDFDAGVAHPLRQYGSPLTPPAGVEEQATMRMLADRTGGRAFINTNDIQGAIRSTLAESQASYQLGFYPEHESWDGKFHELKLRTKKSGLSLHYRKGYFALEEAQREAETARAALQRAMWSPVDASAVGVKVKVEAIELATRKMDLRVNVAAGELRLDESDGRHRGKLDAIYLQLGAGDAAVAADPLSYQVDLTEQQYQVALERGYPLVAKLVIRPETRALRVVVRDAGSGEMGSVTIPLEKFMPAQNAAQTAPAGAH
ncbi:MAG TPA: VWA domain-containing protein [Candidatus Acidoferrum sp.]|nr:VWA domain-containing protein [Candidatus Acidoferrum sp.]